MANISNEDILKAVEEMPVMQLSELVKAIEDKFGVSAAAAAMPMAVGAAPGVAAEEEEKTEFDVILKEIGAEKIKVIKAVREVTSLGLKEAKTLVESAPKAVKEAVSKEEAEEVKKKFEEVGATMEIS